ncbi:MAG: SIR2 family NAD-dependent protein deacylase [Thermoplasmatota archaeon]
MDESDEEIDRAIEAVGSADKIAVLTGAGMSVESGIAPFRGEGGLWEKFDAEEYATINTLHKNPEKSWELFKVQIEEVIDAEPHEGYDALVELEKKGVDEVITQNVDGLHEKAGSSDVLELHGTLLELSCIDCGNGFRTRDHFSDISEGKIPKCECGGIMRPDAALFGEQLDPSVMERSLYAARESDLMLVIGTSAVVQPAASLPSMAKRSGADILEINLDSTPLTQSISDIFLKGKAAKMLSYLVDEFD